MSSRKTILTPNQRKGIVYLIVLLCLIAVFVYLAMLQQTTTTKTKTKTTDRKVVLQVFDPNTADSVTLIGLGLAEWQVRGIMNYRNKGGKWRTKQAFRELYGMTDSAYEVLAPYIEIDTMPFYREHLEWEARWDSARTARRAHWDSIHKVREAYWDSIHIADSLYRDSLYHSSPKNRYANSHVKCDTVLNLNTADTSALQYIRGIGPWTATRIVTYRERLGGFVDVEQLRDKELELKYPLSDSVLAMLYVTNSDSICRIPVNNSSRERLLRHPYIHYNEADAIYTTRRRKGRLRSADDLVGIIDEETLQRIKPYLEFL